MTTGQQADPALSAAIDAWHAACHDGATIEDGMRRVVTAVRAADLPADMCCEGKLDGSHDDDCEIYAASVKSYLRRRLGPEAKQ